MGGEFGDENRDCHPWLTSAIPAWTFMKQSRAKTGQKASCKMYEIETQSSYDVKET
jgi:hypothetical protein